MAPVLSAAELLIANRFLFFDDLDIEVQAPQKELMHKKLQNDSLLYSKGRFIHLVFYNLANLLIKQNDELLKLQKEKVQLLVKYKKVCERNELIIKQYDSSLVDINSSQAVYAKEYSRVKTYLSEMKKIAKKTSRLTAEEWARLEYEYHLEKLCYTVRKQKILARIAGVKREINDGLVHTRKQLKQSERFKSALLKKFNIKET